MNIPEGLHDFIISNLIPIKDFAKNKQKQFLDNIVIETHPVGSNIFKQGEIDEYVYYLLIGKLKMKSGGVTTFTIETNAYQSLYPVGQMQPRQYTANVSSSAQTLKINKSLFDSLSKLNNSGSTQSLDTNNNESALNSDYDWMTELINSKIFANIPPNKIQMIFELFEEKIVNKNEVIITKGDKGDYYYIIKKGEFVVTRDFAKQNKTFKLATLFAGEGFGEEALLGDMPRNANVTSKTDGSLMRITKESFLSLIRDPSIESVDYDKSLQLISNGGTLLDVRFSDEFKTGSLEGSLNYPLDTLRVQMKKLNLQKNYIVYCDNGSRSAIAAYLLQNNGFTVSYLQGGIINYPDKINLNNHRIKESVDIETTTRSKSSKTNVDTLAKQIESFSNTESTVQNILSQQDDMDQLSKALSSVLAGVFKQLEHALKGKALAEIAKSIAEQKLEHLQKQAI